MYNFSSYDVRWTVATLAAKMSKKHFILDGKHLFWDTSKKNDYIESLRLGLPTGLIVLAETDKKHEYRVVDGSQRLLAIDKFYQQGISSMLDNQSVLITIVRNTDLVNLAKKLNQRKES